MVVSTSLGYLDSRILREKNTVWLRVLLLLLLLLLLVVQLLPYFKSAYQIRTYVKK